MKAVIEDVRLAVDKDRIATLVRQANDVLVDMLHDIVKTSAVAIKQLNNILDENTRSASLFELEYTSEEDNQILVNTGDRVEVFWLDNNCYCAGTVERITETKKYIAHEDGKTECLDLENEQ